jgi:hypothetical protein
MTFKILFGLIHLQEFQKEKLHASLSSSFDFIWLNSFAGISIRVHPLGCNQLLHLDSDMFFL